MKVCGLREADRAREALRESDFLRNTRLFIFNGNNRKACGRKRLFSTCVCRQTGQNKSNLWWGGGVNIILCYKYKLTVSYFLPDVRNINEK